MTRESSGNQEDTLPPVLSFFSAMEVMSPETQLPGRNSASSSASAASSPEFEFWMVRNPSNPQTQLLPADELFVDGVILPLHLLHIQPQRYDSSNPPEPSSLDSHDDRPPPLPQPSSSASVAPDAASVVSSSKKWKDIFRGVGGEKKVGEDKRRRNRKSSVGRAAELNINIWPFSRSRSAGNSAISGTRQKSAVAGRSASSAPCSRSNSRGESSKVGLAVGDRSPVRVGGGVRVGRSNPIWQVRRGKKTSAAKTVPAVPAAVEVEAREGGEVEGGDGAGGVKKVNNGSGSVGIRVLNLNVNSCIGYGQEDGCGAGDKEGVCEGGGGGNGGSYIKLKALFSKKVS